MSIYGIILTIILAAGNAVYTGSADITYEMDGITYYQYETDDLTYEILTNRNGRMIVEHLVGKVLDEDGNGIVMNTEDDNYNYISYSHLEDIEPGQVYDTYLYYNPDNNYEDDILYREDIPVKNFSEKN